MKHRVRQFWDCECEVYHVDAFLKRMVAKSLYQLERMGMNGALAKAIPGEKPSADTVAYAAVNGNSGELKDYNAGTINTARYNKVFQKGLCKDGQSVE